MTISQRLWLLVSVLIGIIVVMVLMGGYSNKQLSASMSRIIELTDARSAINKFLLYTRANREQVMLLLQHDPSKPEILALHDHASAMHIDTIVMNRNEATEALAKLDKMSILTQSLAVEMRLLMAARSAYIAEAFNPTVELLQKEQFVQANMLLIQKMNPLSAKVFGEANKVFDAVDKEIKHKEHQATELASQMQLIFTTLAMISLIIAFFLAMMSIRAIKASIREISSRISLVASSMIFSQSLPNRRDEFAPLVADTNRLFATLDHAIHEANRVVTAVANADFTQQIKGNYVGDLAVLQQGVNHSANSVSFMMGELEKIMNGLNAGQFDLQMDSKKSTTKVLSSSTSAGNGRAIA